MRAVSKSLPIATQIAEAYRPKIASALLWEEEPREGLRRSGVGANMPLAAFGDASGRGTVTNS